MTDEQMQAIAVAGAEAFAEDVHGRSGFDHVLEEAGYYEDASEDNVYTEEIRPEWIAIARGIVDATIKAME